MNTIAKTVAFALAAATASLAVACTVQPNDSTTTSAAAAADTKGFCTAYCTRVNECDNGKDLDTCRNNCETGLASSLPKLRGDVTSQIQSCIDAKDCKAVLAGNVTSKCVDEASESIAPSDAAKKFCDDYAAAKQKCGVTVDKAKCLGDSKVYNDASIASASACLGKACSDVSACVSSAFGSSSSSSGGSSSSSGGSSSGGSSSGGSSSGDGGAPAPTCSGAITWSDSSCNSCMATSCCSEQTACTKNADCTALLAAINACSTQSCIDAAVKAHPTGTTYLRSVITCMDSRCPASCN